MNPRKIGLRVLELAREKLATGWTQGAMARTAVGDACTPDNPAATCFCSLGALHRAYREVVPTGTEFLYSGARTELMKHLTPAVAAQYGYADIIGFNDNFESRQDTVLQVFDDAIASMRAEAQL